MNTKSLILELLEDHRGESISGERIAEMLNVSRNAVWKAVRDLRRDGYDISAATNKGYCLSDSNDIISAQGIKPFLSNECLSPSEKINVYSSLESTNKTAKEMALSGAEHGTVVIADMQTSGRGRYERSFFSKSGGGLYMSFVLRPEKLRFENTTAVTAFAAVSVCEAIESVSGITAKIKWVNDIFADNKKICGILTEAATDFESGSFQWIVLGIGINVNIAAEDFPAELQNSVGSVYPDKEPAGARNRLAAEIINRISGTEHADEAEIFKKYKKRLMMLGKEITVIQGNNSYRAKAVDIDSIGRLIAENENGELITLASGEISIKDL